MGRLFDMLDQARRLRAQEQEIRTLRAELEKLRVKNDRMQVAMRRCVTCDYRLEVVGRR